MRLPSPVSLGRSNGWVISPIPCAPSRTLLSCPAGGASLCPPCGRTRSRRSRAHRSDQFRCSSSNRSTTPRSLPDGCSRRDHRPPCSVSVPADVDRPWQMLPGLSAPFPVRGLPAHDARPGGPHPPLGCHPHDAPAGDSMPGTRTIHPHPTTACAYSTEQEPSGRSPGGHRPPGPAQAPPPSDPPLAAAAERWR